MLSPIPYWVLKLIICSMFSLMIVIGLYLWLKSERQEGYHQAVAEYTQKQLLAEQTARDKEANYIKQLEEAQNAATLRDQQIHILSVAVNTASVSLRDSTRAISNGLPTASADALRKTADAALTVFADCQNKYGELAENADRHASDVETLEAAWPK